MNAGPDVERLIAGWLHEEAPGRAPDRILELAGRTIDRTHQRRFFAWRPTMFARLAAGAGSVVLAIGALTLGAFLIRTPDIAAGPCPPTLDEADAIDTFAPGLTQSQRAWGIAGGVPGRVDQGRIAAFAYDPATDVRDVVAIDPERGERCLLIRSVSGVVNTGTQVDWSPSGDALAIGVEDSDPSGERPDTGNLFIRTADRLIRVWSGEGTPYVEWSPDGRSIAVWSRASNARIVYADGSADQTFEVRPGSAGPYWDMRLEWSPDGSRWVITHALDDAPRAPTAVSIVELADGRVTPVDLGIERLAAVGWIDDGRLLVREWDPQTGSTRYLDVPAAAPQSFSVVPLPEDALGNTFVLFSPDHSHAAYVVEGGPLSIVDVTGDTPGRPVFVDPGGGVETLFLAWSPDGSQVLFHTDEPVGGQPFQGRRRIWIVNADGSGLREINDGREIAVDDPWQPLAAPAR